MLRHTAIVTTDQALELLTEFELRTRVGERAEDIVQGMASDHLILLLAAAKQVHSYAAAMELALTAYPVEYRGADPLSMTVRRVPTAGAHG